MISIPIMQFLYKQQQADDPPLTQLNNSIPEYPVSTAFGAVHQQLQAMSH
jgi:hypothetical protein